MQTIRESPGAPSITIMGPLFLVVDNLSPNASLLDAAGTSVALAPPATQPRTGLSADMTTAPTDPTALRPIPI